jgi:hypothetical protein
MSMQPSLSENLEQCIQICGDISAKRYSAVWSSSLSPRAPQAALCTRRCCIHTIAPASRERVKHREAKARRREDIGAAVGSGANQVRECH